MADDQDMRVEQTIPYSALRQGIQADEHLTLGF